MNLFRIIGLKSTKKSSKEDKPVEYEPDPYGEVYEKYVRRYTKSEMAAIYNRSVNTLIRWINADQDLLRELNAFKYNKWQKEFKKEQVRIIFKHLGEPDFKE